MTMSEKLETIIEQLKAQADELRTQHDAALTLAKAFGDQADRLDKAAALVRDAVGDAE